MRRLAAFMLVAVFVVAGCAENSPRDGTALAAADEDVPFRRCIPSFSSAVTPCLCVAVIISFRTGK